MQDVLVAPQAGPLFKPIAGCNHLFVFVTWQFSGAEVLYTDMSLTFVMPTKGGTKRKV